MVSHRCYTRIRPYIFGCLYHIYYGIDRKYYSHNCDRGSYASHKREGEEELTKGIYGNTSRHLCRKLFGKSEYAKRQCPDKPMNNIAAPISILQTALERLRDVLRPESH